MDQPASPQPQQKPPAQPAAAPYAKPAYGKGYGKRPLWQWILIYVVVGGIVYAAVYYFVFAKRGYSYTEPAQAPAGAPGPSGAMPINNGQPTPPPPNGQPQNW